MPPKGALAREQVAAVRAWVEAGATTPASRSARAGRGGLVVAAADPDGFAARVAPVSGQVADRPAGSRRRSMPSSWPASRPRA